MAEAFLVFVVRIFLEILDMWDSHSCACTCSAIVILLAVGGNCLNMSSSGGSSVNETSCEISASVLTWNEGTGSANDNRDDFDVRFEGSVGL